MMPFIYYIESLDRADIKAILPHMNLNWNTHINKIAKKIGKGYGIITKVFFTTKSTYHAIQHTHSITHKLWHTTMGFCPGKNCYSSEESYSCSNPIQVSCSYASTI